MSERKMSMDTLMWLYERTVVRVEYTPYRGMDDRGEEMPVKFTDDRGEVKTTMDALIGPEDLKLWPRFDGLVAIGRRRHEVEREAKNRREKADLYEERQELQARLTAIDKKLKP